ncbi:MAG: hypothetical protein ACRDKI_11570 [Solirubrobacterales bacterium]
MKIRLLVFTVVIALLTLTQAATASDLIKTLPGPFVDQDFAWTGSGAYVVRDGRRGRSEVLFVTKDAPVKRALSYKPRHDGLRVTKFAGSSTLVAANVQFLEVFDDGSYDTADSALAAGVPGGSMRVLSKCPPNAMAVGGSTLAAITRCGRRKEFRATIWSLTGARVVRKASFTIPLGDHRPQLQDAQIVDLVASVNDHYLAIDGRGGRGAIVYDWTTGKAIRRVGAGQYVRSVALLGGDAVAIEPFAYASQGEIEATISEILRYDSGSDQPVHVPLPEAVDFEVARGNRDGGFVFASNYRDLPHPHRSSEIENEVVDLSTLDALAGTYTPLGTIAGLSAMPFSGPASTIGSIKHTCWDTEIRAKGAFEQPESPDPACAGGIVGGSVELSGRKLSYRVSFPDGCPYFAIDLATSKKGDSFTSRYGAARPHKPVTYSHRVSLRVANKLRTSKRLFVNYYGSVAATSAKLAVKIAH